MARGAEQRPGPLSAILPLLRRGGAVFGINKGKAFRLVGGVLGSVHRQSWAGRRCLGKSECTSQSRDGFVGLIWATRCTWYWPISSLLDR